jgi:hypothetical protein
MTQEEKIKNLKRRIDVLEQYLKKINLKTGLKCDHQTIPWGQHKRKCGKCGEVFVV